MALNLNILILGVKKAKKYWDQETQLISYLKDVFREIQDSNSISLWVTPPNKEKWIPIK